MIKIRENQITLNTIIYDTGNVYACNRILKKVIVKQLEINENSIVINNMYRLYKIVNNSINDYYCNRSLYFSEKKATNVVNNYILQAQQRNKKYEKEKEIQKYYENKIIEEKLEEKYIDKFIMINRGEDGWVKTKCKEVYATKNGIYIRPSFSGHLCKLSREGKTWKMWSELEELEEQKRKLEEKIKILKGEE